MLVDGFPFVRQGAILALDLHVDADVFPVAVDQLHRVGELEVGADRDLDRESDAFAVRAASKALAVSVGVAGTIEVLIGLVEVIFGVLRRELLVVELRLRTRRALPRRALPLEDDVDQLLTIDGVRQSDPKVRVVEDAASPGLDGTSSG